VAHFMAEQNGHDGEAEGCTVGEERLQLLRHRHDIGEELLRFGRGEGQTLIGSHQKRGSDGQEKEDELDERKRGLGLESLRVGRYRELDADGGSRR